MEKIVELDGTILIIRLPPQKPMPQIIGQIPIYRQHTWRGDDRERYQGKTIVPVANAFIYRDETELVKSETTRRLPRRKRGND